MTRTNILIHVQRLHDDVLTRLDAFARHAQRLGQRSGSPEVRIETLGSALHALEASFERAIALEHDTVFRAVVDALPAAQDVLATHRGEHRDVQAMIAALRLTLAEPASAWRDERLRAASRDLVDLLQIHLRKEEAAILRVLERILTPAELAQASRHTRKPPHAPHARAARGSGSHAAPTRRTARRTPCL